MTINSDTVPLLAASIWPASTLGGIDIRCCLLLLIRFAEEGDRSQVGVLSWISSVREKTITLGLLHTHIFIIFSTLYLYVCDFLYHWRSWWFFKHVLRSVSKLTLFFNSSIQICWGKLQNLYHLLITSNKRAQNKYRSSKVFEKLKKWSFIFFFSSPTFDNWHQCHTANYKCFHQMNGKWWKYWEKIILIKLNVVGLTWLSAIVCIRPFPRFNPRSSRRCFPQRVRLNWQVLFHFLPFIFGFIWLWTKSEMPQTMRRHRQRDDDILDHKLELWTITTFELLHLIRFLKFRN